MNLSAYLARAHLVRDTKTDARPARRSQVATPRDCTQFVAVWIVDVFRHLPFSSGFFSINHHFSTICLAICLRCILCTFSWDSTLVCKGTFTTPFVWSQVSSNIQSPVQVSFLLGMRTHTQMLNPSCSLRGISVSANQCIHCSLHWRNTHCMFVGDPRRRPLPRIQAGVLMTEL